MGKKTVVFLLISLFSLILVTKSDDKFLLIETNALGDEPEPGQGPEPTPVVDHDEISQSAESVYSLNGSVSSNDTLEDTEITSNESDVSIVKVSYGGSLKINSNVTLRKTGGDSSYTEYSEFYGINAGILVTKDSELDIENIDIITNATGSNAVFATGENAYIKITNGEIYTHGKSSSRGLDATYTGEIYATNVTIETEGGSCATLATDRGEGTVTCIQCTLTTHGSGSPVIYSTGTITVEDTVGKATGAQFVVVEGKNSANIKNSKMTATGDGNRGEDDSCGVMIYQSQSGDAGEGKGYFTCQNSDLSLIEGSEYYSELPFFFITNTLAQINTTGCTFTYGSETLISVKGTSQWGTSGSNGGGVEMYVNDQTIEGDIVLDSISNLTLYLVNSTFIGAINNDKQAQKITIILDASSTLNLTGDSYVNEITNGDSTKSNIIGKGKLNIIESSTDSSSSLEGWAIALIVIACIVVIVGLIFLFLKCKKKDNETTEKMVTTEMKTNKENE